MTRQCDPGDEARSDHPAAVVPAADDYTAIRQAAERLTNDKAAAEAMLRLKDQLRDSEPQPTTTARGVFSQAKPTLPDGRGKQPLVDTPGMVGNPLKPHTDQVLSRRTYDRLSSVETAGRGVAPEVGTDPPHKATQENATFTDEDLDINDAINIALDCPPPSEVLQDMLKLTHKNLTIPEVEDITIYPIEYGFAVMVREGHKGVCVIREDGRQCQDKQVSELLSRCQHIRKRWPGEATVRLFEVAAETMGGWHVAHTSDMMGNVNLAVQAALKGTTERRVGQQLQRPTLAEATRQRLAREDAAKARMEAAWEFLDERKPEREKLAITAAERAQKLFGQAFNGTEESVACDECGSTNISGRPGDIRQAVMVSQAERGIAMTMACSLNSGLMRKLDEVIEDADRILEWLQTGV